MTIVLGIVGIFILLNVVSLVKKRYNDPYRDIFFIMGKPGSGKSTYFVNKILQYEKKNKKLLKKGKQPWAIYSDTPINIPGVRIFDPLDLAKCYPDEKSVLFIDEISLVWDARKFKQFDSGVSEFMKLHRHAKVVIYCASQNFDCDKRIRDLCTHFHIVKQFLGVFCLVRPVKTIFPIFTEAQDDKGSQITSGYEWASIFEWKLFYMPKCFKYFNTRSLPERPPLPYKEVQASAENSRISAG